MSTETTQSPETAKAQTIVHLGRQVLMNRLRFPSVAILLCLCFSGAALAEEPTFAKLQAMCKDTNNQLNHGYCVGFVEAIAVRTLHENRNCTLLQDYIDQSNSNLVLPDLIADLNPKEYSGNAFEAVEKFFLNKGCS